MKPLIDTQRLQSLITVLKKIAPTDGEFESSIPGVRIYRSSSPTQLASCTYLTGLAVMVQGEKDVLLGERVYHIKAGESLVTSADLPVMNCVTYATEETPYFGIWIELDIARIAEVVADMQAHNTVPKYTSTIEGISVISLDELIADALIRLIKLRDEPTLIPHVAPLIHKEIAARLLQGPYGTTLRQVVAQGSPQQRILNVMTWLKANFHQPMHIDALAAQANMSASAFRKHFRGVTGMSPLQYVKHMRLFAARQLMLNDRYDAGRAAVSVGYESASQFSREYARLFGDAPIRDIRRMRIG